MLSVDELRHMFAAMLIVHQLNQTPPTASHRQVCLAVLTGRQGLGFISLGPLNCFMHSFVLHFSLPLELW